MFTDVVVYNSGKLQSDAPAPIFSLFCIVVWYLSRLVLSMFSLVIRICVYLLMLDCWWNCWTADHFLW